MIAVDTNLLVYALRSGVDQHGAARAAIERAAASPRGWGVALQSIAELWMVVTHPSAAGGPASSAVVALFLERLREDAGMQVFEPRPGFTTRLVDLATTLEVAGPRIFDLQIGLTAWEAGARELWTHDRRFRAPPQLRVVDPL